VRTGAAHRGFTLIELMVAVFISAIVLSMGYGAVNQALANHEALDARQERLLAVQTTMRLFAQDFTQLAPRPVRQPLGDGWLPACLSGTPTGGSSLSLVASPGLGSAGSQASGASPGLTLGAGATPPSTTATASTSLGSTSTLNTGAGTFTSTTSPVAIVTLTRAGWANPAGIQRPALERVSYILENGTLRREHWPVLDAVMTTTTVRRELLDKVKSVTVRYMDVSFNWRDQWPPQALAGDPTANLRLRPIAVEVTLDLEDWGTIVRVIEVAA
jgi:type II secretion system protein J